MLKTFKYRLNPTNEQSVLLNKHIGANRFIYNLALECKNMAWNGNKINLSCFSLQKQLKDLKNECDWLKEINSQSLQQSILHLDKAYNNFFKGLTKFPKFKKKSDSGSFSIPQNVNIRDNKLIIPKFKKGIKIVLHRTPEGEIKNATITKTTTGKYFVSILCETGEKVKTKVNIKEDTTIGIDLGIKMFLTTSTGEEINNPKFLYNKQNKLKFIQRKYSKHKGKRTKKKLALLHEKIANQRKDFLHKVSTNLIKNHDTLAIETLSISNMIKNHNLAQSISDVSWYTFITMLDYKSKWYGKNIIKIDRFEPSSKMCSKCGAINKELVLADREWTCKNCNTFLHRDINAAMNIKSIALKNILSGIDRKNHDELSTIVEVMTHEAQSDKIIINE